LTTGFRLTAHRAAAETGHLRRVLLGRHVGEFHLPLERAGQAELLQIGAFQKRARAAFIPEIVTVEGLREFAAFHELLERLDGAASARKRGIVAERASHRVIKVEERDFRTIRKLAFLKIAEMDAVGEEQLFAVSFFHRNVEVERVPFGEFERDFPGLGVEDDAENGCIEFALADDSRLALSRYKKVYIHNKLSFIDAMA
jgi:hypothetical protein